MLSVTSQRSRADGGWHEAYWVWRGQRPHTQEKGDGCNIGEMIQHTQLQDPEPAGLSLVRGGLSSCP